MITCLTIIKSNFRIEFKIKKKKGKLSALQRNVIPDTFWYDSFLNEAASAVFVPLKRNSRDKCTLIDYTYGAKHSRFSIRYANSTCVICHDALHKNELIHYTLPVSEQGRTWQFFPRYNGERVRDTLRSKCYGILRANEKRTWTAS